MPKKKMQWEITEFLNEEKIIRFKKRKKRKRKTYKLTIHFNNLNGKFCGCLGYYSKKQRRMIWIYTKNSINNYELKEDLYGKLHEIEESLVNNKPLVKRKFVVLEDLREEELTPPLENGSFLPKKYLNSTFELVKEYEDQLKLKVNNREFVVDKIDFEEV